MSIESKPYYWVACDAPGCTARCPDETDDYSAFSDDDGAIENAVGSEWTRTRDGRDYCDTHASNVCERCEKYDPTPLAGERDYLCMHHWLASKATP